MKKGNVFAIICIAVMPLLAEAQGNSNAGGAPVTVVNSPSSPVPVTVTNTPSTTVSVLQPFQREVDVKYDSPTVVATAPAGKRLIVEFFSTEVYGTVLPTRFFVGSAADPSNPGNAEFLHFIPPPLSLATSIATAQPVLVYVDPGHALIVNAADAGGVASGTNCCFISVSGHFIDIN